MSEIQPGELLLLLTAVFGLSHFLAEVLASLGIPAGFAAVFGAVGDSSRKR